MGAYFQLSDTRQYVEQHYRQRIDTRYAAGIPKSNSIEEADASGTPRNSTELSASIADIVG